MNRKNKKNTILVTCILLALSAAGALIFLRRPAVGKIPADENESVVQNENGPVVQAEILHPEISGDIKDLRHFRGLYISELMTHNSATLPDSNGNFPDWIEIGNSSDHGIDLEDCAVSDKKSGSWKLPAINLGSGEFIILFADGEDYSDTEFHTDFSLADEESVFLFAPGGEIIDSVECLKSDNDCSVCRSSVADEPFVSPYPTPGFPNTPDGYDEYQESLVCASDILINEVKVDGSDYWGTSDYIELVNASDHDVSLHSYYLSDKGSDPEKLRLPDVTLAPGELYVVECAEDSVPFSLSSRNDQVYLSDENGIVDHVSLKEIPAGCSFGREEACAGWFYFPECTPGEKNTGGYRRISARPVPDGSDGIFEGIKQLEVILSSPGEIYYTLDCSEPTENSIRYSGPITVDRTCVIKAVAVEVGLMKSPVTTLSYFINEGNTLPVLNLVGSEPSKLDAMTGNYKKEQEIPGTLSFYEGSGSFSINCGISLAGNTSLRLNWKSFKVHFRSCYGDSELHYDLFDNGIEDFNSLTIRKGQDNDDLVFLNELWESLASDMSDSLLVEGSKFCALYINGRYYGICVLKEDLSSQFFASRYGVSKESVERVNFPIPNGHSFFEDVIMYCVRHRKLSDEDLEYLSGIVDIDSVIDWLIMEGVCGNFDLQKNVCFFRSSEHDGKWHIAFFDLDGSFNQPFKSLFGGSYFESVEMAQFYNALFTNEGFVKRFLTRYSEVYNTDLSNEAIIERMESYKTLLSREVERDRKKWKLSSSDWYNLIARYEKNVTDLNWEVRAVDAMFFFSPVSSSLKNEYFPELCS